MLRLAAAAFILAIMAIASFLALHERPLPDTDFTYAMGDAVRTLDPAQAAWNYDIRITLGLWEGLTNYHPETSVPIPGVATLPPDVSPDGRTFIFTLRPEAKWSNGEPVTAQDFVRGWRRAIEPGTARDYAALVADHVQGARKYMDWRNNAVRTLSLLYDLTKNRPLSESDSEFLQSQLPADLHPSPPGGGWPERPGGGSSRWARGVADEFRREHLAQLESRFADIGIRALDPHHLQVTLTRPTAYFLELTAFSTFLPIHESIDLLRDTTTPAVTDLTLVVYDPQWVKPDYHRNDYPGLITNGPFTLADWQFKRYMFFQRNPHYWDRANVPSRNLLVRIMPEPSTAFLAYEKERVDWLDDLSRLDFAPALAEKARLGQRDDIHISPAFGTYFYWFNCQETLPDGSPNPFRDPLVRQAFTLAVDRQAIVAKVSRLGQPVAQNLVPPGTIPGYYCPPGPAYNPQRARELLAQAGYPDGQGLPTIEILYNTGYTHDKPAQAIAEMWAENLSVHTRIQGKEIKSFDEDKRNHRFMVLRASWYGDYSDPTTFLDMLITGNGNNDPAFSLPKYDRLMQQATHTLDPQKRLDILAQAENLLANEQMPYLPLYYYVNSLAYRPNVRGIYPNARNMHPLKYFDRIP